MSLLTHAELAVIKLRRSQEDLKALIAHAEETLGTAPLLEGIVDEEGNYLGTIEHPAEESDTTEGADPGEEDKDLS